MLRLPKFSHHAPDSLDEAVALLKELVDAGRSVKLIAGGTDLLPNMKHEITTPEHVVSLRGCGLNGIRAEPDKVVIGAMTTVDSVARSELIRQGWPALADACSQIAGPQLRKMGTLGGNICLDTRCLYINQSYFWRSALGFCLKRDGTVCHVVAKGQRCVAAASNDSVLPLMLYGASVVLVSPRGCRQVPLADFFVSDGVKNTINENDEILSEVHVPASSTRRVVFEKLRIRKDIDYPLLNLAVGVREGEGSELAGLEIVVSALGARPKRINLDKLVRNRAELTDDLIAQAAKKAHAACRPLTNIATDPAWRREMVPVLVKRALRRLRYDVRQVA